MVSRAGADQKAEVFDAARVLAGLNQVYLTEPAFLRYAKVEVAGPGFINFWLSDEVMREQLAAALESDFGRNDLYKGQAIVLEHRNQILIELGFVAIAVTGDEQGKLAGRAIQMFEPFARSA